jgi:hypothetical protein
MLENPFLETANQRIMSSEELWLWIDSRKVGRLVLSRTSCYHYDSLLARDCWSKQANKQRAAAKDKACDQIKRQAVMVEQSLDHAGRDKHYMRTPFTEKGNQQSFQLNISVLPISGRAV